jgi:hypothetical protein
MILTLSQTSAYNFLLGSQNDNFQDTMVYLHSSQILKKHFINMMTTDVFEKYVLTDLIFYSQCM